MSHPTLKEVGTGGEQIFKNIPIELPLEKLIQIYHLMRCVPTKTALEITVGSNEKQIKYS